MKNGVLILLVSLLCSGYSTAEEVKWYDWNEAQMLAEELNKPIMVFVHASWCHICQRMDTKVFTDAEVASFLNNKYIPVKLDAEFSGELLKDGNPYTTMKLLAEITGNQFRGIPAYIFIPKKSKKKNTLVAGLKDPKEMRKLLKKYK